MEAILAFGGGVAAAVIGAVVAVGIEMWRRTRKVLGWEELSANVIIPFESRPGEDLEVRVRSSLVQEEGERDDFVPVGRVYGFRVRLKNVGNVPIESQEVFLTLDDSAKMLSLEVEQGPVELWGRIATERQHQNRFTGRCVLPFLNPGQELILSAQSVDNQVPACFVYAPGVGLSVRDMESGRLLATAAGMLLLLTSVAAFTAGVAIWGELDSRVPSIALFATAGCLLPLSVFMLAAWGEGLRALLPPTQGLRAKRRSRPSNEQQGPSGS